MNSVPDTMVHLISSSSDIISIYYLYCLYIVNENILRLLSTLNYSVTLRCSLGPCWEESSFWLTTATVAAVAEEPLEAHGWCTNKAVIGRGTQTSDLIHCSCYRRNCHRNWERNSKREAAEGRFASDKWNRLALLDLKKKKERNEIDGNAQMCLCKPQWRGNKLNLQGVSEWWSGREVQ